MVKISSKNVVAECNYKLWSYASVIILNIIQRFDTLMDIKKTTLVLTIIKLSQICNDYDIYFYVNTLTI